MQKDKKEEIKRVYSGLSNSVDAEDLRIINLEADLEAELSEMKELYESYPDQYYFNNLSSRMLNQEEQAKTHNYQPSFAYAFAIAVVVFITSQLFNFNSTNIEYDYSNLINATDIEEYFSLNQSTEFVDFDEMINTEIEMDYTAYLLSNSQGSGSFQSSVENEILNLMDESIETEIYNELASK